MAEIKIRKKRPVWAWIIGVLLGLGLFVYFFVSSDFDPAIDDIHQYTGPEGVAIQPPRGYDDKSDGSATRSAQNIAEYLSDIEDTSKLGSDVNYTRSALVQLTVTVQSVAKEYNVHIDKINTQSKYDKSQSAESTSNTIRLVQEIKDVGEEVATAIVTLQEEKFPELADSTEKIKRTLGDIESTTKMSQQKKHIIAFFNSCGDALQKIKLKSN